MAHVGHIEYAVMGRTIGSDQSTTVKEEIHVQILQTDIMHHLIIGSLQESGVDCYRRFKT